MSFVGPRPALHNQFDLKELRTKEGVHLLKPGIIGWAQVNGRNNISWKKKFYYDVWYVDNQSLFFDLKIIFLTVIKVFKGDGISAKGEVTMKKFTGNK